MLVARWRGRKFAAGRRDDDVLHAACRNNENLGRLSCKITSPLVFAHVRAAYPGMPVSEQNCHPFQVRLQHSHPLVMLISASKHVSHARNLSARCACPIVTLITKPL